MTRFSPAWARRGVLAAAIAALALPAFSFQIEGEPKIAFIYGATARDGGWNEALDNARMAVESELGVSIATVESIPEDATALKNAIDLFVGRGFNVIVGTTYGYSEGILEAAAPLRLAKRKRKRSRTKQMAPSRGGRRATSDGRFRECVRRHERSQSGRLLYPDLSGLVSGRYGRRGCIGKR